MLLALLYWIILILSVCGLWIPEAWPNGRRVWGGTLLILLVIIGLRIFRIDV